MKMKSCIAFLCMIPMFHSAAFCAKYIAYRSENRANLDSIKIKSQNVSVVFWNVENLYDPYDDSTKLDDEFTSPGQKHWNWTKFSRKLNQVSKTLLAAGEWAPPAVIGLCEIENRYVLNKLIYNTPLQSLKYKIVHHESPDLRGVDVALLYRPDIFRVVHERNITIRFPFDTLIRTREILMVKGVINSLDTIHVFVNHWPSRRGGYLRSQPRRNYVAAVLKGIIDSIQQENPQANILAMGDFNDEPEDESLKTVLKANTLMEEIGATKLYNLMGIRNQNRSEGTLKYRDQWSTFDQFVVSGALINGRNSLITGPENVRIIRSSFLFEDDKTYFGEKLKRTYVGPRYQGGFSDHLPIHIIINQKVN